MHFILSHSCRRKSFTKQLQKRRDNSQSRLHDTVAGREGLRAKENIESDFPQTEQIDHGCSKQM